MRAPSKSFLTRVLPRMALHLGSALLLLFASACGGDTSPKEITETREIKRSGGLGWTAPEGWSRGPDRNMRLVTYLPDGRPNTQCYITVLSGRAGGVAANLNRWRTQMGKAELTAGEIDALAKLTVLGRPSPFIEIGGDFTGMSGDEGKDFLLLGVICSLPEVLLTVKMTGPAAAVKAEKDRFIQFCESLHD